MDSIDSANSDLEKTLQQQIHELAELQFFFTAEFEGEDEEDFYEEKMESEEEIKIISTPDHWLALSTGLAEINKGNPYVFLARANYHLQKRANYRNYHYAYKNIEKALKIEPKNDIFQVNSVLIQESVMGWGHANAPEIRDFKEKIEDIVSFKPSDKKFAVLYNDYAAITLWFLCDHYFSEGNMFELEKWAKYQSFVRENLSKDKPEEATNLLCLIDCYTMLNNFAKAKNVRNDPHYISNTDEEMYAGLKATAIRQLEMSLEKYGRNADLNNKLLKRIKKESGHKAQFNIPFLDSPETVN